VKIGGVGGTGDPEDVIGSSSSGMVTMIVTGAFADFSKIIEELAELLFRRLSGGRGGGDGGFEWIVGWTERLRFFDEAPS